MKDRLRLALRSLIPSRKGGQASIQEARNTTQEFLPIKIDSGPGLIGLPFYTFNDRQLIIFSAEINPGYDLNDNSFTDGIHSLDLAVAWSASAPAWTKLTRPRLEVISTIGGVILNKEGSIMYHFNAHQKRQGPVDWEDIPYPEVRINLVLSDVYIFDIETSIWTMETTTPVGYFSAACAVSGDHLILYGGMSVVYNPHPDQYASDFVANGTPSIYNMKTRTWVSVYTPS
ncbi:hypothetical protein BGZ52_009743 [Haplosporangium bisporale]|nr:hypothetical protein BGZ52_009743 [Haplosporangium bisporale]